MLDLDIAARDSMGQDPICCRTDFAASDGPPAAVRITRPYGMFGNNVYQVLNAALAARASGCGYLLLDAMRDLTDFDDFTLDGLHVSRHREPPEGAVLEGSFYVPFGFERAVLRNGPQDLAAFTRRLTEGVFSDIAAEEGDDRIAVHIRSGDVFNSLGAVPFAYVQPPASYYLKAICHARAGGRESALVDLVYQDRANPAVDAVEHQLLREHVPFRSASGGITEDYRKLTGAAVIIASASTFVETAALLSRRLRAYYSFRDHSSQAEFKPFMQANVSRILNARGVACTLIDDVSRTYTNKWCWTNTPEQHAAIRDFPAENLRLYESL